MGISINDLLSNSPIANAMAGKGGQASDNKTSSNSPVSTAPSDVTTPATTKPIEPLVAQPAPSVSADAGSTVASGPADQSSSPAENLTISGTPGAVPPVVNEPVIAKAEVPIQSSSPAQPSALEPVEIKKKETKLEAIPETIQQSAEVLKTPGTEPKDLPVQPVNPTVIPSQTKVAEPVVEVVNKADASADLADIKTSMSPNASGEYPYTMDQLLEMVVQKNASDLHISAGYPALIRIDGELIPVSGDILSSEVAKNLIFSITPDDAKEVVEVSKETDIAYAYKNVARFRVNIYHSMDTVSAALRLIPSKIRTIEELKLPAIYTSFTQIPQGLILVTGPTGHGKSTTLAAILNEINLKRPVHMITIEDPVEYVYPKGRALVNQREMKHDTHSWEIALKSILREDPDVVLIGEMRDYETISAAITIAETGHLVFATLHTNSASQTIDRIIDVFPEHQQSQIRMQLSVVIEGVVAQRLVKLIGGGRRAVSEVMLGTPAVRNIIREGKTYQLDNVIRTSGDVGMLSIEKSLVDLVREGKISVEDAQMNAVNPEEVMRLLK